MEGKVSGLGTVHPLLTLNVFSTWFLPLFNRKISLMDELHRRRERRLWPVGPFHVHLSSFNGAFMWHELNIFAFWVSTITVLSNSQGIRLMSHCLVDL